MTTRMAPFPLRLPVSLKAEVKRLSKRDRTSVDQFLVIAATKKLAAMQTEEFFAERRRRADDAAFFADSQSQGRRGAKAGGPDRGIAFMIRVTSGTKEVMDVALRKYTSIEEMKADEYRYWQSRPAHERFDAVEELNATAYAMKGMELAPDVPRLQRPFVRIQCPWS